MHKITFSFQDKQNVQNHSIYFKYYFLSFNTSMLNMSINFLKKKVLTPNIWIVVYN